MEDENNIQKILQRNQPAPTVSQRVASLTIPKNRKFKYSVIAVVVLLVCVVLIWVGKKYLGSKPKIESKKMTAPIARGTLTQDERMAQKAVNLISTKPFVISFSVVTKSTPGKKTDLPIEIQSLIPSGTEPSKISLLTYKDGGQGFYYEINLKQTILESFNNYLNIPSGWQTTENRRTDDAAVIWKQQGNVKIKITIVNISRNGINITIQTANK